MKKNDGCNVLKVIETDKRGTGKTNPFNVPEAVIEEVRNDINLYPVTDSHHCRETTKRGYLEEGLTIAEMHRRYQQRLLASNKQAVSEQMYRKVFSSFNYGFFKPKNDRYVEVNFYVQLYKYCVFQNTSICPYEVFRE